MEIFWYVVCGIICGVLGGMGMGGGTLLIPALTIFFSVNQHVAQGINLISFIPMAIVALIIHVKNKLINFKGVLFIIVPALVFAYIGTLVSKNFDSQVLKKCFGGFLVLLSIVQIIQIKFIKKGEKN
ncbi:MAG: sulfite exporter TauE/SafE family protein [Clostridia bacterium]|nr:sulfite exporter TauE/SafE family protein [Clostridia bacterium]